MSYTGRGLAESVRRRDFLVAGSSLTLAGAAPFALARPAAAAAPEAGRALDAARFGARGDGRSDDTTALQRALDATFEGGEPGLLTIPPGDYRISRPLRIALVDTRGRHPYTRRHGIAAHGARLVSDIHGGNVVDIDCRATDRFFLIDGLSIQGRGGEGHGIAVNCSGGGHYFYNFCLRDLVVQGCGGDGLRMIGNIFEGQVFNGYFRDNKGTGATFGHNRAGGILSALHVFGAVFGGNGGDGVALINGAYDVAFHGCYFLLNRKYGVNAGAGCTLLDNCGFENNHQGAGGFAGGDAGIRLMVFGTLVGCTAYSIHNQTGLIRAYITNRLVMTGCTGSGGGGAHGAGLARLQGNGKGLATLIGCYGRVTDAGGVGLVEIGGAAGGARFGASWNSPALPRLGEYVLWVDNAGRLRIKRGEPRSESDGSPVGA